jgi:putative hemolysin
MLSTVLTSILIRNFGGKGLAISIVLCTFLLLIFGEVTPKILAIKKAEDFSHNIARPLEIFTKLIFPLRYIFNRIADTFIKAVGIHLDKEQALTPEELKAVIELSHRHGIVKENEKEMIRSVLELTQTNVLEIMTPRPDIKALSLDTSQNDALELLKHIKYSKVPVYKDTVDNITGILYSKDLFFSPDKDFKTLIKPPIFIPETKRIDELLKDFQTQKTKIAVVVDEYGSTCGVVTLEDILEEIVGEIYDEFDTKEKFIEKISDKSFRIDGKSPIYLINDKLDTDIPEGDYDTVAGYVLFLFKKIPQEGEFVKKGNKLFRIDKLAGRRIKSIILEKS